MKPKDKLFLKITFSLFLLFILMGIGAKRILHHREWVIPLHLTAAVFLAFWGHRLFRIRSASYQKEILSVRRSGHEN